jgi:hypothetical protein
MQRGAPVSIRPERCHHEYSCCARQGLSIRTGGEERLSDLPLWEPAYAELLFTDRMWPGFDKAGLEAALAEFGRRERRFRTGRRDARLSKAARTNNRINRFIADRNPV